MGKKKKPKRMQEGKEKKEFIRKVITGLTVCGTIVTITGFSIADAVGLFGNKEADKNVSESVKESTEGNIIINNTNEVSVENILDKGALTETTSPTPTLTPEPDWQSRAEGHNKKGLELYNSGQYEEAIEMYDQAIALETEGIEDIDICYYNRGRAYYKLGNYEKAVGDFTISIEINPRTKYYSNRAEAYRALGDNANAALDDTKAIINAFE